MTFLVQSIDISEDGIGILSLEEFKALRSHVPDAFLNVKEFSIDVVFIVEGEDFVIHPRLVDCGDGVVQILGILLVHLLRCAYNCLGEFFRHGCFSGNKNVQVIHIMRWYIFDLLLRRGGQRGSQY